MTGQEFTGERFIPGLGGAAIAYEHMHRYLYASRWAEGKEVLDIATGSGYGAALLARTASHVHALDLDHAALLHASRAYVTNTLSFCQSDAALLPLRSGVVDLVVAFEVLEHLADPEALVREAARVVRADGMVLISTPDKAVYSDARGYVNPFHTREFYRDEFAELLGRHFRRTELMRQRICAGSLLQREESGPGIPEVFASPLSGRAGEYQASMYLLAVCSQREVSLPASPDSVCLDLSNQLIREWHQRLSDTLGEVEKLNDEIRRLGHWAQSLGEEIAGRDAIIRGLQEELRSEVSRRDAEILRLGKEHDAQGQWARSLENDVRERDRRIDAAIAELDRVNAELRSVGEHLRTIRHALPYRVLCRLGILPK